MPRARNIALIVSLLVAIGLLVPLGDYPEWQPLFNLAHIPLFAALAASWSWVLRENGQSASRTLLLVGIAGVLMAAGSELAQFWIPGRWPDLEDFARDLVGLALGLAVGRQVRLSV